MNKLKYTKVTKGNSGEFNKVFDDDIKKTMTDYDHAVFITTLLDQCCKDLATAYDECAYLYLEKNNDNYKNSAQLMTAKNKVIEDLLKKNKVRPELAEVVMHFTQNTIDLNREFIRMEE